MLRGTLGLIVLSAGFATSSDAQSDDRAFDFWAGTWHQEVDGMVDTSRTRFVVRRGIHPRSFEEEWRMVGEDFVVRAKGIRFWDDSAATWRYLWLSEEGHAQLWEGKKYDGQWYITKRFDIDGDRYLSRQAWIPLSADRLTRVSERSTDDGITWTLRFREHYRKAPSR